MDTYISIDTRHNRDRVGLAHGRHLVLVLLQHHSEQPLNTNREAHTWHVALLLEPTHQIVVSKMIADTILALKEIMATVRAMVPATTTD